LLSFWCIFPEIEVSFLGGGGQIAVIFDMQCGFK
jgi:hypothetical protein